MFPSKQTIMGHVKTGAKVVGTLKGLWDTGKVIYGAVQTVAPYVAPLL